MKFIHFTDRMNLNSILENGIQVNDSYRGKGILVYPKLDVQFKVHSSELELINEERAVNQRSIYEKWEIIGALGLRQNGKSICALSIELTEKHWPLEVYIDVRHQIAKVFGELLDSNDLPGVKYSTGGKLSEVVQRIESKRFVLESSFIVNTEKDLKQLIKIFQKSGGGVWGAHSLDCKVDCDIPPNSILEVINLKTKKQ